MIYVYFILRNSPEKAAYQNGSFVIPSDAAVTPSMQTKINFGFVVQQIFTVNFDCYFICERIPFKESVFLAYENWYWRRIQVLFPGKHFAWAWLGKISASTTRLKKHIFANDEHQFSFNYLLPILSNDYWIKITGAATG